MTIRTAVLLLLASACGTASPPSTAPATAPAPAAAAAPLLYVCNQNDATISVIDPTTMRVVRTVDLKALGFSANAKPHHIAIEPDGRFWYVTLIGDNKIVKLDHDDRVVAQASFETPGMLALHPVADLLFVGRSMTAVNPPPRIGVLRRSDMKIDEVDVLFPRPHAMALQPTGETVYTASLAVNQMAAIDVNSERVEITQVSGPAHALMQFAVSPNGRTLAVSAELSGKVLFFDLGNRMQPRFVAEVAVERQPFDPAFTPDGQFVVLGNKAADAVTIINAVQHRVVAVVRGKGLAQPHGVAISPDGRFAYVSNNNLKGTGEHAMHAMVGGSQATPAEPAGPGTVVAIDMKTHRIASVLQVGHNASGIAFPTRR